MIVAEPPCDLLVVFADSDAQRFCEQLIERGQERRCIRPLRWRSLRDPLRDTLVHDPRSAIEAHLSGCERFLLVFDHRGSGREDLEPPALEAAVEAELRQRLSPSQQAIACAFSPMLEELLVPTWERAKDLLAAKRGRAAPGDAEVLARLPRVPGGRPPEVLADALAERPKALLDALLEILQLRHHAALFAELGGQLSAPKLKQRRSLDRLMGRLQQWFPPVGVA